MKILYVPCYHDELDWGFDYLYETREEAEARLKELQEVEDPLWNWWLETPGEVREFKLIKRGEED